MAHQRNKESHEQKLRGGKNNKKHHRNIMIGPKTGLTQVICTWRVKEEGLEQVCGTHFKKESIGFYFLLQS